PRSVPTRELTRRHEVIAGPRLRIQPGVRGSARTGAGASLVRLGLGGPGELVDQDVCRLEPRGPGTVLRQRRGTSRLADSLHVDHAEGLAYGEQRPRRRHHSTPSATGIEPTFDITRAGALVHGFDHLRSLIPTGYPPTA